MRARVCGDVRDGLACVLRPVPCRGASPVTWRAFHASSLTAGVLFPSPLLVAMSGRASLDRVRLGLSGEPTLLPLRNEFDRFVRTGRLGLPEERVGVGTTLPAASSSYRIITRLPRRVEFGWLVRPGRLGLVGGTSLLPVATTDPVP